VIIERILDVIGPTIVHDSRYGEYSPVR
jgi:hypothetical protein